MINAEYFRYIFGMFASELWSMPKEKFYEWINQMVYNTGKVLVDKEVVLKEIEEELKDRSLHEANDISEDYAEGYDEGIRNAYFRANNVPAVVKKTGKWVRVSGYVTPGGDPTWRCSECGKGKHVWGIEHNSYGVDVADHQWVTCPNCGIEMEGEKW